MTAEVLPYPKAWNNLSSGWNLIPLKYGFDQIGSGTTPPTGNEEYYGGGIPWVTTSELRENVVETTEKTVSSLALEQFSSLKLYPSNTVMIAMYGATIGRIGLLGTKACVNQAVLAMAHPTIFEPRFVAYVLQASRDFLLSLGSGGGQPNLNAEKIKNFVIPCPSIFKQKNIVEYLDEKTAVIDHLITAKQRLLKLLDEKRRALITHAVTRGLDSAVPLRDSGVEWIGRVPQHWDVVNLKMLADVRTGVAKGRKLDQNRAVSMPYLRVANVQDGFVDLSDISEIEVLPEEISRFSLQKGDVLMNEGGDADKLGRGAVWSGEIDPCLHQNHVFAVRCLRVNPYWLSLVTSSESAKAYFESRSKQSTNLASISATNLKELPVPLPSLEEQSRIVTEIDSENRKLENLKKVLQKTIVLLQERRTALIAAAVSGQHPVADQS